MHWTSDILGSEFEQTTITLKNDYAGEVVATLVRKSCDQSADRAILYIHGFNDYFFQKEMADKFNGQGLNFYALDIRRYGRSFRSHQKFNDIRNLKSYYEEIMAAIEIIKKEGNSRIILMGHSTGGLIATLFAKDYSDKGYINGVILNSPFYDFNMSSLVLGKLIPVGATIGKVFPSIQIDGALSEEYGESLHKDYDGEWDYNLNWKPCIPPPIALGWLRAIREGHKELRQPFAIVEPVLVLHSTATVTNKFDKKQMHTMDAVLSVADIDRVARNIEGDVDIVPIKDGIHDLILSRKDVREKVYQIMKEWIAEKC